MKFLRKTQGITSLDRSRNKTVITELDLKPIEARSHTLNKLGKTVK